jgi:hypothetical protein
MGKHDSSSGPSGPVSGLVTEETWAKILLAAVQAPNGEKWFDNALASEENAQNN